MAFGKEILRTLPNLLFVEYLKSTEIRNNLKKEITAEEINQFNRTVNPPNLPPAPSTLLNPQAWLSVRKVSPLDKQRKKNPWSPAGSNTEEIPVFPYFLSVHCLEKPCPTLGPNWGLSSTRNPGQV